MKTRYLVGCIFFAYIAVRLYFLFTFPPFTDESLYIRWGQLAIHDQTFRWAALSYLHRQPLAIWLFGIGSQFFGNLLYGARLMVLFVNIPIFFALWSITRRIFSTRTAMYSILILSLNPLFILTQTMAMMDGVLFALSGYIVWLFIQPWRTKIPLQSFAISILLGVSLFIKSTALMLIILSVVGLSWKALYEKLSFMQIIASIALWILIPLGILTPLLTQPNVQILLHEPDTFILTPAAVLSLPIRIWTENILAAISSVTIYFTPLALIFLFVALPKAAEKRQRLLTLWWMLPLFITICIGKNVLVRYFVIGLIGLVPLLAHGMDIVIERIEHRATVWICGSILGISTVFFILMPANFFHIFPTISGEQAYGIGWPSGYGVQELTTWIDARVPADKMVILAVADSPGNPSDYLLAYYYLRSNIRVIFVTTTNGYEFKKTTQIASKYTVYFATRGSLLIPEIQRFLKPVKLFQKPYNQDFIGLYEIILPKE